ncbi:MAG: hypothetical protein ACRDIY_10975 [Chloroflexota bacterium]
MDPHGQNGAQSTRSQPATQSQPAARSQHLTQSQRADEARRLRDRFAWLNSFNDEEIGQISFCETGAEMAPGDTYFDVSFPENGPFVGQPGQLIPEGGCLIQQRSVPASIWEKLVAYPPRR